MNLRDFEFQLMELIRGKSEEQIEELVLKLCDTYGLNYYQIRGYVDDLISKMK